MMNKTWFFSFIFFFAGHLIFAQNNPLEKRTTIGSQKEPLENVLALITKQTGVRFSYNSQLINPNTKVTIDAKNKTIKEILFIILPANVSYKRVGEHIVFFCRKQKTEDETLFLQSNLSRVEQKKVEKNTFSNNGTTTDDCLDSVSLPKETVNLLNDTVSLTKEEEEMKAQIAGLMLAVATASTPIVAQNTQQAKPEQTIEAQQEEVTLEEKAVLEENVPIENTTPIRCKPIQLTFIYPLGTGLVRAAENCYHASINIIGGVTGQTKGFEVGSVFNVNKYGATGAQFAGVFNITETGKSNINSRNAQFAGVFNVTQRGKSAQFAGVFNIGDTAYFQAGGIFNIAKNAGFQAAGIFNHANTAHFQAAGIWNTAKKTKCQIAGIGNVAQESVCQIAGIVNVTKKGRFQMGLINVRDTADGVSLGLINIVKKGGVLEAGIEAGEFVHTAITFRSGVQRLYSIIYAGYNFGTRGMTFAMGAGLGTSVKLVGNLSLNFELTHATFYPFRTGANWITLTQFRPVLNYRFAKHFKMYVGPTLNLFHETEIWWGAVPPSPKIPYSFFHRSYNRTTLDMWIGVVGGIKF